MTIFAVFDRDAEIAPTVVADRFSWFAALLPPVYAIVHRLWLDLALYVLAVLLLGFGRVLIGASASFWIYVAFAVWIGFEASGLRRAALIRRGWHERTEIVAATADLAQLESLKHRQ